MKILIAEDDATSKLVLETCLRKWGYEVISTCNGAEALAVLKAEDAPSLAILDWMMPDIDGTEVCRQCRQKATEAPPYLILLTALGRKDDIVAGLKSGADDYVTKPFDREELHARIQVGQRVVELYRMMARQVRDLHDALAHVRKLQGILPICIHCHRIRDDNEAWHHLEHYIQEHSDAQFSHGLCKECLEKHYPKENK